MPKADKETAQIFKSLRPDSTKSKAVTSTSVREVEHRWPLFKTTPPKKFNLTPELSEVEKAHWLSSKKLKIGTRKSVLSITSSVSNDKLAESLKKMAGPAIKFKSSAPGLRSSEIKAIDENKRKLQEQISLDLKKEAELKKNVQIKKTIETKMEVDKNEKINNQNNVETKEVHLSRRQGNTISSDVKSVVDEPKSLRGLFGRVGKSTSIISSQAESGKKSILSKLSKR